MTDHMTVQTDNKHLEGPWREYEREEIKIWCGDEWMEHSVVPIHAPESGEGHTLAFVPDDPEARLIAAAPDLLEVAEHLVEYYDNGNLEIDVNAGDLSGIQERVEMAREAIAKAMGEEGSQ